MARIQPVLTQTELTLVDQMAELTGSKRTDVIESALTVYHWFVRQVITGGHVVACRPSGEEVTLETAELAVLEGKAARLSAEELGSLAKGLANCIEPGGSGTSQGASHARLLRNLKSESAFTWAKSTSSECSARLVLAPS